MVEQQIIAHSRARRTLGDRQYARIGGKARKGLDSEVSGSFVAFARLQEILQVWWMFALRSLKDN